MSSPNIECDKLWKVIQKTNYKNGHYGVEITQRSVHYDKTEREITIR